MVRKPVAPGAVQEEEEHPVLGWVKKHGVVLNRAVSVILAAVVVLVLWRAYAGVMERRAQASLDSALAALAEEDFSAAAEQLEDVGSQYLRTHRGRESLFYLGEARYRQGDADSALSAYRRYLEAEPRGVWAAGAQTAIGYCLEAGGNLEAAMKEFATAASEHPESAWAVDAGLGRARCQEVLGRFADARASYEALLGKPGLSSETTRLVRDRLDKLAGGEEHGGDGAGEEALPGGADTPEGVDG